MPDARTIALIAAAFACCAAAGSAGAPKPWTLPEPSALAPLALALAGLLAFGRRRRR